MSRFGIGSSLGCLLAALTGCGDALEPGELVTRVSAATLELAGNDTFINSTSPDNNNGASASIFTGRSGMEGMMRGLVSFQMPASLRNTATVTGVELRMVTRGLGLANQPGTAATVVLEALTQGWVAGNGAGETTMTFTVGQPCGGQVAGATWNHTDCATGTSWTAPGGAVEPAMRAVADVPAANDAAVVWTSTAEMVSDVQRWIDDPSSNHGWRLRSSTETTAGAQRFHSRESEAANAPRLTISYACKAGFVEAADGSCTGGAGGGGGTAGGGGGAGTTGTGGVGGGGSESDGGCGCSSSGAGGSHASFAVALFGLAAAAWSRRRSRARA